MNPPELLVALLLAHDSEEVHKIVRKRVGRNPDIWAPLWRFYQGQAPYSG